MVIDTKLPKTCLLIAFWTKNWINDGLFWLTLSIFTGLSYWWILWVSFKLKWEKNVSIILDGAMRTLLLAGHNRDPDPHKRDPQSLNLKSELISTRLVVALPGRRCGVFLACSWTAPPPWRSKPWSEAASGLSWGREPGTRPSVATWCQSDPTTRTDGSTCQRNQTNYQIGLY